MFVLLGTVMPCGLLCFDLLVWLWVDCVVLGVCYWCFLFVCFVLFVCLIYLICCFSLLCCGFVAGFLLVWFCLFVCCSDSGCVFLFVV